MTDTNFLGIPVEGEVNHNRRSKTEQKGKEDLALILQPLLDHPAIEAVRWDQYTPYFNDGDVCEFSICEPEFKFAGFADDSGDNEDGFVDPDYASDPAVEALIGGRHWDDYTKSFQSVTGSDPVLGAAVQAFKEISAGTYDDLLLETFGDHAQVTVTPEKIIVDFYEHE